MGRQADVGLTAPDKARRVIYRREPEKQPGMAWLYPHAPP